VKTARTPDIGTIIYSNQILHAYLAQHSEKHVTSATETRITFIHKTEKWFSFAAANPLVNITSLDKL
jgi:hypothetical protein